MKIKLPVPLLAGFALTIFTVQVSAQTPTPPASSQPGVTGEVTGLLVNESTGGKIPESLSIMLHILDQNYNQVGMLHAQSSPDGSFRFEDVPLDQNRLYAGIAAYEGATYYSQPVPYDGVNLPEIELPIYEGTKDLSKVQVDEMHVLFNFAQDGLEVNEIYIISNLGDRTITGSLTLTDGQPATIEFPLPDQADYVFFKPDSSDRFVRLDKGFADKAPLVPGQRVNSMMVSYLLPYTEQLSYSYTAPLTISKIDYLLPAEQNMLLDGPNLTGPEITTLPDQSVYQDYSYNGLLEGQTVKFSFLGKPNIQASAADPLVTKPGVISKKLAIEIGSGIIGLAMIGVGIWQWQKSRSVNDSEDDRREANEIMLHKVAAQIASLDDAHEKGTIDEKQYHQQRSDLLKEAKTFLKKIEN